MCRKVFRHSINHFFSDFGGVLRILCKVLGIIRTELTKYFWYQFIKKTGLDCSLGFEVQYELILII